MRKIASGQGLRTLENRLYYRAQEVAALTGLGLRTIYGGISAGWIPSRKIGNSRLIPASWLHALSDAEADAVTMAIDSNRMRNIPKNRYSLGYALCAA